MPLHLPSYTEVQGAIDDGKCDRTIILWVFWQADAKPSMQLFRMRGTEGHKLSDHLFLSSLVYEQDYILELTCRQFRVAVFELENEKGGA